MEALPHLFKDTAGVFGLSELPYGKINVLERKWSL